MYVLTAFNSTAVGVPVGRAKPVTVCVVGLFVVILVITVSISVFNCKRFAIRILLSKYEIRLAIAYSSSNPPRIKYRFTVNWIYLNFVTGIYCSCISGGTLVNKVDVFTTKSFTTGKSLVKTSLPSPLTVSSLLNASNKASILSPKR